jgi:hypothetical protein
MSDEQDSWFKDTFGLDVGQVLSNVKDDASSALSSAASAVTEAVQGVEVAVEGVVAGVAGSASDAIQEVAQAVTSGAASGAMGPDCNPVRGHVPGPAEHLLCQTHGHIVDISTGQIIAASLETYKRMGDANAAGGADASGFAEPGASREEGPVAPQAENDTSSALPVMAGMGAPASMHVGPEGPISGVRLIEKGAKAVAVATLAVGAAPLVVAAAVGVAILTVSSKLAPPWMSELNPETGQPYKDEDEWNAVRKRRAQQQRGGGRQPQPGPNVAPDDPDAEPQAPTCSTQFPGIDICSSGMGGYGSMDEAAKAQPEHGRAVRKNVTTMDAFKGIPGGENGHATYYDSAGNKLFTLINRPCCTDTAAGPVLTWRWVVA